MKSSIQHPQKLRSTGRIGIAILIAVGTFASAPAQTGFYTQNGGSSSDSGKTYSATSTDQSAIYVYSSGQFTATNCTMTKTGDATSTNTASQYGTNAGVLTKSAGKVIIIGGSVTTNASGANGLFATGTNSSITMSNGTISASGGSAHGVDVTYGGSITLTNVDVTSTGANSSTLATDFGGGTVTVTGGTIRAASTASGSHSAGIYSTGTISVTNAVVSSAADCGGVIDGANSINLTNTTLTGAIEGFKLWKTAKASGAATVSITGGSVTVTNGDCFYVTGTTGNAATGTLTVKSGATISASTGVILRVDSVSTATITIDSSSLSGNLISDANSTITARLQNNAGLTGMISTAALTIDASSSWTLTGTSYLTTFSDAGGITGTAITNITGNGYNAYYDASLTANSALSGKTYSLLNGGSLLPKGSTATAVEEENLMIPATYVLNQNYPNPFNPKTVVSCQLPVASMVRLVVYDILGREAARLLDGEMEAGRHEVTFDGSGLASGTYIYRLTANNFTATRKMQLLK
jgi:hypothetical protein